MSRLQVMEKLVDIVHFLHLEIRNTFGTVGMYAYLKQKHMFILVSSSFPKPLNRMSLNTQNSCNIQSFRQFIRKEYLNHKYNFQRTCARIAAAIPSYIISLTVSSKSKLIILGFNTKKGGKRKKSKRNFLCLTCLYLYFCNRATLCLSSSQIYA